MKTKFTTRELAKINAVLDAYKEVVDTVERYDNAIGCGNCGDLGPTYKTLHNLRKMFETGELPKLFTDHSEDY